MKKLFYLFCCMLVVLFAACEETEPPTSDKIVTGASENITQASATLKGAVNVDIAAYNSVEFGIMYDTLLAEVNNRSAQMVKGSVLMGKDFSINLADLTENTKYYYCAYLLLNGMQYDFGAVKEFTTLESIEDPDTPDVPENPDTPDMPESPDTPDNPSGNSSNGHEYVDLGLSVKWATCNVGANAPEAYGDYFAWGEISPKSSYSSSNYSYSNNPSTLPMSADAANANWGGTWRMPTRAEKDELRTQCTWTWTTQNGVKGYTVTSRTNGNSIFLPAAGYHYNSDLFNAGSSGYYWSSSVDYSELACNLGFNVSYVGWDYYNRHYGRSVRPVLP